MKYKVLIEIQGEKDCYNCPINESVGGYGNTKCNLQGDMIFDYDSKNYGKSDKAKQLEKCPLKEIE